MSKETNLNITLPVLTLKRKCPQCHEYPLLQTITLTKIQNGKVHFQREIFCSYCNWHEKRKGHLIFDDD